jgi:O-antigen ligase
MVARGPGLAATTMPVETLAGLNRGRLRGWVAIAAIGLVVLAFLSWPNLLGFLAFLGAAAASIVAVVWIHFTLPDVETGQYEKGDSTTNGHD